MRVVTTGSVRETEACGEALARSLTGGTVVALFGGLGMGKTAFVRGMARALAPQAQVSSPTFALVNDYGGDPAFVHFDMYRIHGWDDLYATGFFDYLDAGAIMAVEWSENIEAALPEGTLRITFEKTGENSRRITVGGEDGR